MIAVGIDSNVKQFARDPRGVDRLPKGDPYHGWMETYPGADYLSMRKVAEKLLDEVSSGTNGEEFRSTV